MPATCTTREIYQAGCILLEKYWNNRHPVRLIGISLSGFREDSSTDQLLLFDQTDEPPEKDKITQIDKVMDRIRNKHGAESITFATLVKKEKYDK